MRMHAAEIARADGVPLWSRGIFGGFPLLADVEVGALYPPNLLFLFLSPALAMNLLVVCTYWLAGLATFAYCRSIGASPLGGLVAAFTYMLSGFMVAHLGHVTIIGGAAWLPLLLHRLERLREQPSRRQAAVFALVVALQALGSHPQLVLGSWLLCTAYARRRRGAPATGGEDPLPPVRWRGRRAGRAGHRRSMAADARAGGPERALRPHL